MQKAKIKIEEEKNKAKVIDEEAIKKQEEITEEPNMDIEPENVETGGAENTEPSESQEELKKEYLVLIGILGNKKNGERIKLSEKEAKELLEEGYIKEIQEV